MFRGNGEDGAGMAHGEALLGDEELYMLGQAEEAKHIGDGAALFAGAFADLIVAEVQFAAEAFEGVGDFNRVEVFALDVLDEGNFEEAVVGEVLDDDGYFGEASESGGTPAAFARDELIAVIFPANDEWLDDAVGGD